MRSDESAHNQVDVLNFLVNEFCLFVTYSDHSMEWLPPYELRKCQIIILLGLQTNLTQCFQHSFVHNTANKVLKEAFGLLL